MISLMIFLLYINILLTLLSKILVLNSHKTVISDSRLIRLGNRASIKITGNGVYPKETGNLYFSLTPLMIEGEIVKRGNRAIEKLQCDLKFSHDAPGVDD